MISILYADNDKDDREMMDDFFSQYPDIELLRFSGGAMLIDYVKTVDEDLLCYLMLDIEMAGLNGINTLKQLRALGKTKYTKAVLLSHSISDCEIKDALNLSAELIKKPLTKDKVVELGTHIVEYCYKHFVS